MTLKVPNLDDRSFEDLRREALAIIEQQAPQWTDRSPSDPGITLLELFAHLTEVLIYRVNRMPEKAHVTLLNLLGVGPRAPAPAEATLTFRRSASGGADRDFPALTIPAGTVVTDRAGTVSFYTVADTELAAQPRGIAPEAAPVASVIAVNAERVEGELLGIGTGAPGQSFTVRRGPILRRPNDPRSLVVGVQSNAADGDAEVDRLDFEGRPFSIWREVDAFSGMGAEDRVYVVDRANGIVSFGAGGAGAVPPTGSEVRAWYLRGGGRAGNVAPGVLLSLKKPIPGVEVSNADRASGGEDMESVEAAIARGREAVRVLRSAVTARDFENVATEVPGIARARAYAQRDVWYFGRPGTVDVLIVPSVGVEGQPDGITAEVLAAHQTPELLANTREHVRQLRPVGVESRVEWARCRPVDISARVVLSSVEDRQIVAQRLNRRLHALLAPDGSWPFGRPLRVSDVYEALLSEPGFRYAENLVLSIADAPDAEVRDIHRDQSQPSTLYVAGRELFRSQDSGGSWSSILERPGESFLGVRTNAILPGLVAAFSRASGDDAASVVYVSEDGGESWDDRRKPEDVPPADRMMLFRFPFEVRDIAWGRENDIPVLYVAGRSDLKAIRFSSPVVVEPLPVRGESQADQAEDARGFEAVATARHVSGLLFTAVAAREQLGVYLSAGNGPFRLLPDTTGQPIRTLAFQQVGNETFLWAGFGADKGEAGKGAMRIGMRVDGGFDPTGWEAFAANWTGGSCEALDFLGDLVAAGTNRAGVLLWTIGTDKAWSAAPAIDCGLPLIDERRAIQPIFGAALGQADTGPLVLAGGDGGTYISLDRGRSYRANGRRRFEDRVPLPRNWLFCSGRIILDVTAETAES